MKNPLRTLLFGLFIAPVLRVLQGIFDWIGNVTTTLKSNQRHSQARALRVDARRSGANGDTRSHWEKMDVVAPIYKLAGEGLNDRAIALNLNLPENTVYECIAYLVRQLKCQSRAELVLYAASALPGSWNLRSAPTMLISGVRRWRQRKLADSLLAR